LWQEGKQLIMKAEEHEAAAEETIKLDQFLKLAQVVESGGQAKQLILSGMVWVNGMIEMRRGRKLRAGDVVVVDGEELVVETE
jgi:ribosome-associated protein